MKTKLLLAILLLVGLSACQEDPEKALAEKQKAYYLDEDFILINKKESTSYDADANKPVNIRTWVINRVSDANDSIEVAEIMSDGSDCGCKPGQNFVITDELWYNKIVGDKLHFDFIRKDRFTKIVKPQITYTPDYQSTTVEQITSEPSTELDFDKERQIMEIERRITDLQRELDNIKK